MPQPQIQIVTQTINVLFSRLRNFGFEPGTSWKVSRSYVLKIDIQDRLPFSSGYRLYRSSTRGLTACHPPVGKQPRIDPRTDRMPSLQWVNNHSRRRISKRFKEVTIALLSTIYYNHASTRGLTACPPSCGYTAVHRPACPPSPGYKP